MDIVENGTLSMRVAGSFRDPSGYVFERMGRIYRAIDEDCHQILRTMDGDGLLTRLIDRGLVVGTHFVGDEATLAELRTEHPGFTHFLEHDRIAPVTYPHEWCVSMLADAALHTLDLQAQLLADGYALKDATAYNIQFVDGRPTFIDLPSIERPERLDVWIALGQFAEMFTFPLLLARHYGWDLRSYFLGSLNGRDLEQVARSMGRFGRWRPRALLDVALPLLLNRRANAAPVDDRRVDLARANREIRPQLLNLDRLRAKVRKLAAGYRPQGIWSEYTSICSYDDVAEQAKVALVRQFLEATQPSRVLDLGCNTGRYSELAAACGARVIAVDSDHDAVEILYRRLRGQPASITPLVIDLGNPSPALGFRNRERASFLGRIDVDCVLALAVIHHLHVAGNLPIDAIRDHLWEITGRHLVLEFVPREDVMFKKLTRFRRDDFADYSLEACRQSFGRRFRVVREEPVPNSPRTLLLFEKEGA